MHLYLTDIFHEPGCDFIHVCTCGAEAIIKDANRYRWIRGNIYQGGDYDDLIIDVAPHDPVRAAVDFDALIDREMRDGT